MRRFSLLLSVSLLAACSNNVEKLNTISPAANDFSGALAAEYQAYADSEKEQGRTRAAQYYAGKGIRALKGEVVEPEPADSGLSSEHQQELADNRARLMTLWTDDVKKVAPQQLARAQLLFDCWQHQLDKELNQEHAPCADEFHSTLVQLQEVADPLVYGKTLTRNIVFSGNSVKLSAEAVETVKAIADSAAKRPSYRVQVTYYAAKQSAQRKLSDKRLAAIRHQLLQTGIPARVISVKKEGGSKAVVLSNDKIIRDPKRFMLTLESFKEKDYP